MTHMGIWLSEMLQPLEAYNPVVGYRKKNMHLRVIDEGQKAIGS